MLDPKSQHRLGSGVKKMNPVSSFLLATFASNPSGKSRAGYGRGCHRPVARQPRSLLRLRLQCYRHKINALRWSGKKVGWILAIYIERFTVSCLLLTLASFVFWMSKHISWLSLHGAQNVNKCDTLQGIFPWVSLKISMSHSEYMISAPHVFASLKWWWSDTSFFGWFMYFWIRFVSSFSWKCFAFGSDHPFVVYLHFIIQLDASSNTSPKLVPIQCRPKKNPADMIMTTTILARFSWTYSLTGSKNSWTVTRWTIDKKRKRSISRLATFR